MTRLNPWVLGGIIIAEVCLAIWGGASVIVFALALHTWPAICWIPAVALGGVMLASTMFSIQPGVDREIRVYSGLLALCAIAGELIVAGAMHYFEAKAPLGAPADSIQVAPEWGFVIGALPSLMGGALIHITAMYFAQRRREEAEAGAELTNLETARGIRATNAQEEDDARRTRDAARQAEESAATRSRQAVQHELQQAQALRAKLAAERTGVEEENTALDEARREQERLRSRDRRRRGNATTQTAPSQPPSQPTSHDGATEVQTVSQTVASREDRRKWAREQLERGVELTGAAIDRQFPDCPRNGAAVLREARAELFGAMDGERKSQQWAENQ